MKIHMTSDDIYLENTQVGNEYTYNCMYYK